MEALLLLALAWTVRLEPDLSSACFDPEPQQAAPTRREATPDETAAVSAVLTRQDQRVLARQSELALGDYAADFRARDFGVTSAREFLARLDSFVAAHRDVALASALLRVERVGDCLVADVRRSIDGIRRCDETPVHEEAHETVVLRQHGEKLEIAAFYEREESLEPRVDRKRRIYDAASDLLFTLKLPEPFVPVPRLAPGAGLDRLLLLDPADDAELELMMYDPTIDQPLDEMLWNDITRPGSTFLEEPTRFEKTPPAFVRSFCAEIEYAEEVAAETSAPPAAPATATDPPPAPAPAPTNWRERAIYLTPDHRLVFAAWITAPAERFDAVRGKVDELVRSLRLEGVKAGRPWHVALTEANPRWKTLKDGIFRPESVPIEMVVPAGLAATPLLGDHIVRLRLSLIDDLRSTLIVRVFPKGENRVSANKILENTVQRMTAFACAEGIGGDSRRLSGIKEVLGQHGDWNGVEIVCSDGSRRTWQIVAVDRADCHVQVQLLPGSSKSELQSAAMTKVLEALRIRED